MLNNGEFLNVIKESFRIYLEKDTSRSNEKLKPLHGAIARDLQEKFGPEFKVKSLGIGDGREGRIAGRYYPKNVDITVSRNGKPIAGYAVKFIMRNYSQNSNNYFENMLGETANIRSGNVLYFQIFIIFEKVPYYEQGGVFKKYDVVTETNLNKYLIMSKDNPGVFYHVPDKTLILLLKLKENSNGGNFQNSAEYAQHYLSVIDKSGCLTYSNKIEDNFGNTVILNDYKNFIERTYNIAIGKIK